MKFILETHVYAPELNKIHFINGAMLRAPHVKTIKGARSKLLHDSKIWRRMVLVSVTVPNKLRFNRVYKGYVNNYTELKDSLSNFRKRHNLKGTVVKIESISSAFTHRVKEPAQ